MNYSVQHASQNNLQAENVTGEVKYKTLIFQMKGE